MREREGKEGAGETGEGERKGFEGEPEGMREEGELAKGRMAAARGEGEGTGPEGTRGEEPGEEKKGAAATDGTW